MSTHRRASLLVTLLVGLNGTDVALAAPNPPPPAPPRAAPAEAPRSPAGAAPGTAASPPPPARAEPAAAAASKPRNAAGVVVLERAGKPLGLGTILNGDGRIVTAFSVLGEGRNLDARYADGSAVPVRLGHADRARDLALLVPQNRSHLQGLRASRGGDAASAPKLFAFTLAGSRALPGPTLTPTGPSVFLGGDGRPLTGVFALSTPVPATSGGTPLLDETGEVVAVVTRACRRATGPRCAPELAATSVSEIRAFLQKAPPTAAIPKPSTGVEGVADDTASARGIRVTAARGPALAVGLKAGKEAASADVIVALDGIPVTTPEALEARIAQRAVGDAVDLLVLGGGRYRNVTLVLVPEVRP